MALIRRLLGRPAQGMLVVPQPLADEERQRLEVAKLPWADTPGLLLQLLRNQSETLHGLLDGFSTGLVILKETSEVVTANLSFCRLFHLNRGAVAGNWLQDLLPAAVARRWPPEALRASGRPGDEAAAMRDSSSGRRFRTRTLPILSAKGEDDLLAFFIEELAEEPAVAANADESRRLFRQILESSSEASLLVGADGRVEDLNGVAAELLAYDRGHMLGMKLTQFMIPGSQEDFDRRLDWYMRCAGPSSHGRSFEARFARADGKVFSGEVRLSVWEHGGQRLVMVNLRDSTRQQQEELLAKERLQVVAMVARHQPLEDVLAKLALMIDHQIPDAACALMLRQGDCLSVAASPNLPPNFAQRLVGLPIEKSGTPCSAAVSTGQLITFSDIADSMMRADLRQAALEEGLRASWSTPIFSSQGLLTGAISVYRRQPGEPESSQRELLQTAGLLASVCIEQQEETGRLIRQAQRDTLTGLANRAASEELLTYAIAAARRNGRPLGILTIDLDRFKEVNDTLGHAAGDKLLREVASRMQGCVRGTDLVARWGGDEFLIGLSELKDRQDAMKVAVKLLDALRTPFEIEGRPVVATGTVGISLFPEDGQDLASLMRSADEAMYRAKTSGRNAVQFYTPELTEAARRRLELQAHLGRALERSEFVLHYQPKFDLKTGRLSGLEALLRWQHPELGLLSPAGFIPTAEESGLIVPIGEWVLREACRQARVLADGGRLPMRISVNVSGLQFVRPDFVELVARAAKEAGIDPNLLELDLTEGLLMQDSSQSAARVARLRELGVRVAIDDFGTGYSSLSCLRQLAVDSLKIDRSFIQELDGSEKSQRLVRSIVGLARSLHMKAAAEGVESIAQLSALESAGCDSVQGYLFAKPLPLEEAQRLVAQSPRIAVPHFVAVGPRMQNLTWRTLVHMRPLANPASPTTSALRVMLTVAE